MSVQSLIPLIHLSLFACISAFLFGYDLGLIGGALHGIHKNLATSDAVDEVIVGAAKLGAVLGAFVGSLTMKVCGRRVAMISDVFFFIFGPICMVVYPHVVMLIIGRVVVGVGIGISAVVTPAYLGEVSPSSYRGRMVGSYEVMLCLGMLSASLVDALVNTLSASWKWMVGLPMIPAMCMGVCVWNIPESPRWLVSEGQLEEALRVMHKMYTASTLPAGQQNSTDEVESELLLLWDSVQKEQQQEIEKKRTGTVEMQTLADGKEDMPLLDQNNHGSHAPLTATHDVHEVPVGSGWLRCLKKLLQGFGELFRDIYCLSASDERRAFVTVMVLAMFNQACGSTSIINYAPTVLEEQGMQSDTKAILFSASTGVSKLIGVLVSFFLVDNVGRRPLLVSGSVGSAVSLSILAADALSSVPLVVISMSLFIFCFSLSWAEVFWIILSEVFSMKRKSAAISACTATLFLFGSAADLLFLTIRNAMGFGSFILYAVVSLAGGVFVYYCVPETKGKTLMEVQEAFNLGNT